MHDSASRLQIEPCLAEILRTNVFPPSIRLKVEHITRGLSDGAHSFQSDVKTDDVRSYTPRLFVTDGVLSIQAVLRHNLTLDLPQVGDVLELRRYELRKGKRVTGEGRVIYIGIQDYISVTEERFDNDLEDEDEGGFVRENASSTMSTPRKRKRSLDEDETEHINFFVERSDNLHKSPISKKLRFDTSVDYMEQSKRHSTPPSSHESDDDFETIAVDMSSASKKREALQMFKRESPLLKLSEDTYKDKGSAEASQTDLKSSLNNISQRPPSQLPNIKDAPLHTLQSLLHPDSPLPKRSYACSVFAIISWISMSLIQKPPFPPKRHIKLHDPSIQARHAGITLAVFVDAKDFSLKVGTIALFRGVVMQRWENDVILNAYPNLKEAEDDWCITEKEDLLRLGCDVKKMENWWLERKGKRSTPD